MRGSRTPLAERRRIFTTRNTEEFSAFLESVHFRLEQAPEKASALNFEVNGVYMPGLYFGCVRYGTELAIRSAARGDFWLQIPVRGRLEIDGKAVNMLCSPRRAILASLIGQNFSQARPDASYMGLTLCMYRSAMIDCLTGLLGDHPNKPLAFETEVDLTSGAGRNLAQYALFAAQDLLWQDGAVWSEATANVFQQFVMTLLITGQPHNYSAALQRVELGISPRNVKCATEFMEANLGAPITIQDLVDVTGVPGRTLFKHFQDSMGISPMQYLRNLRFQRARMRLMAGAREASVTDIATEAGFLHLGRFAVEYRKRYGERPSDTLTRGKN